MTFHPAGYEWWCRTLVAVSFALELMNRVYGAPCFPPLVHCSPGSWECLANMGLRS